MFIKPTFAKRFVQLIPYIGVFCCYHSLSFLIRIEANRFVNSHARYVALSLSSKILLINKAIWNLRKRLDLTIK